jgi:AMMECR1 domain-containing protein
MRLPRRVSRPPLRTASLEEYPSSRSLVSALTRRARWHFGAVVLGEDGVILEHPAGRAIFLPEVAAEHGWTLRAAPRAALPQGAASRRCLARAALLAFRSQKFGEC